MAKPQIHIAVGLLAVAMASFVSSRELLEVFGADGGTGAAVVGVGDPTPLDKAAVEMRVAFESDDHRKAVVYIKNSKAIKGFQFRLMGRGNTESHEVEVKDCDMKINSKFMCHGGPTGKVLGFAMQGDGIGPHLDEIVLAELTLEHSSSHICLLEPIIAGENSDALETVVPSCVSSGYDKSFSDSGETDENVEICNGRGCSLRQRAIASGRNPDKLPLGALNSGSGSSMGGRGGGMLGRGFASRGK